MTEERELLRHNNIIGEINSATSKDELPKVTVSLLSRFFASNLYFNDKHLNPTSFASISNKIVEDKMVTDDVKKDLLSLIKKEYIYVSDDELIDKLSTVLSSPRINYLVEEINLRIKKINELEAKKYLDEHNKNISLIKNANEIKEIPTITKAKLTKIISDNTKNSYNEKIKVRYLSELADLLLSGVSVNDKEFKYKLLMACKNSSLGNQNNMYEEILPQIKEIETRINYLVEEINLREKRISKILEEEHDDIMLRIKEAKRISQLPPNLTISTLTGYLSGNTIIYPKVPVIPSNEFVNIANMLLDGKKMENKEIKNELERIARKYYPNDNKAFDLLFEKLSKLPKLYYFVDEINYSSKRQQEFIGRSCSNVNVYFVPNPKSPIDGGLFYNCYINRVDNLNLESIIPLNLDDIVPKGLDVDSLEWYVQEHYDETFKTAGGIILNKDETIGNVNVFQPSEGKIGITKEEHNKYQELEQISNKVKEIISKKKQETNRFIEMQKSFLEFQKSMDEELSVLESKIDSLTEEVQKKGEVK